MKNILFILIALGTFCLSLAPFFKSDDRQTYTLNTSNPGKIAEFKHLFSKHKATLDLSKIDQDEIDSDPLTVITHKASQLEENILVEDTSLEVDGEDVGVNIRWLIDELPKYENKQATWTVYLANRRGNQVYIYKGEVKGTLVPKRSDKGFGFDPYFLPEGATKTLAEDKPDGVNARALAVQALIDQSPYAIQAPIYSWDGPWQHHD